MGRSKLFNSYNRETINKLRIESIRDYYYFNSSNERSIITENKIDNEEKIISLEDEDLEWQSDSQPLYLNLKIILHNIECLFEDETICSKDAILGIGIEWNTQGSKIRKCKKIGEITNTTGNKEFYCFDVALNDLINDTKINVLIYIKDRASSLYNTQKNGLIILNEKLWEIKISGDGSLFPISNTSAFSSQEPLWSVYADFIDIEETSFSTDNVGILLNINHPSYKFIKIGDKDNYNKDFHKEILSSSIYQLIQEILFKISDSDPLAFFRNDECEEGSIAYALKYFKDQKGFIFNEGPNKLLESIKKYIDREFK